MIYAAFHPSVRKQAGDVAKKLTMVYDLGFYDTDQWLFSFLLRLNTFYDIMYRVKLAEIAAGAAGQAPAGSRLGRAFYIG